MRIEVKVIYEGNDLGPVSFEEDMVKIFNLLNNIAPTEIEIIEAQPY